MREALRCKKAGDAAGARAAVARYNELKGGGDGGIHIRMGGGGDDEGGSGGDAGGGGSGAGPHDAERRPEYQRIVRSLRRRALEIA